MFAAFIKTEHIFYYTFIYNICPLFSQEDPPNISMI